MQTFDATDVALSGFRFVREHPRTIALWAALQLIIALALGAVVSALAGPALSRLTTLGSEGVKDPSTLAALIPLYAALLPASLLFYAVLFAMMSRAVLQPAESRLGYIRLGPDEWRQFLLLLLIGVVGVGAEILVVVSFGLLVFLASTLTHGAGGRPWLMVVLVFATLSAFVYASVRLSLASPLTFDQGKVDLFGSWSLTRGVFFRMFLSYLLVWALAIVIYLLLALMGLPLLMIIGGGVDGLKAVFSPDLSSLAAAFSPLRLLSTALQAVSSALVLPLVMMPPAEIYKRLSGRPAV